ncbi:MAG: co-chaperone YbbN [Isosphaeraceae bacterium]|jgi:putative thioredoxin|nr:MAG: co-chaperone YbbN [Isosphaeraceae bacterium]
MDVRPEEFERAVIERSREVPVVVDFWAPWCGPCRMLGPVLEKVAREYAGRFVLAKANSDTMPDIAAAFGVRGIPAVFGLRDGKVVDSFVGVIPESAIRAFVERLLPSQAERLVAEARALEGTDPGAAEVRYREALESAPNDPAALTGLMRVLAGVGRIHEARKILDQLERRGYLEPEAERVKAEILLREAGAEAGRVEEAKAAVEAAPNDLHARFRLAEALAAAGRHAEALELALDLVERDRKGVGEDARKLMLAVFQVLGDSDLAREYRRKLAFLL